MKKAFGWLKIVAFSVVLVSIATVVTAGLGLLVFYLFGFTYRDYFSIGLFFFLYTVLRIPLAMFGDFLPVFLATMLGIGEGVGYELLYGSINILSDMGLVVLLDSMVEGISVPVRTAAMFVMIGYGAGLVMWYWDNGK